MGPAVRRRYVCPPILVMAAAVAIAAFLQAVRTAPVLDLDPALIPGIVDVPTEYTPYADLLDLELELRSVDPSGVH